MHMRTSFKYFFFLVTLVFPGLCMAEPMQITLEEALNLTLKNNPEIMASKADVRSAEAARKQMRGHYGPIFGFSSSILVWDDKSYFSLGSGGSSTQLPAPTTAYEQAFAGLVEQLSTPSKLQDQVTSETKLTVAMPLNQLYQIHQGYKISELEKKVTQVQLDAKRQAKSLEVVTAYFHLLQAEKQLETTYSSVQHLEEQQRVVQSFVDQGMLAKNDLLKIRVALADANQKKIQARSMKNLARANLATVMGLDIEAELLPISVPGEAPVAPEILLSEIFDNAIETRPETSEVRQRIRQSERGTHAAMADMLPNVNLIGAYTHTEGVSMGRENTFYGGLAISWDFWEWGATYYGIDKARANRSKAKHMNEYVERMIRLEIKKALIDFQSATEMLKVAEAAVLEAEEAYDIESRNLAKGMGTTADMLDAETALVKARNNHNSAIFQCYIAKAAWLKAIGETVDSKHLM